MDPSPAQHDDPALLQRVRRGSDSAFRELVRRHGRYLFGVARALVRDAHEAEDVVQETFAAALGASYRGEAQVRTWLVGILVRQAARLRRGRARWRRGTHDAKRDPPPEPRPPHEAVDARLDLAEMLVRVAPEQREVIVLRELQGMSYDEIARTLGIPRGTVESRLHRARAQLRELLDA